MRLTTDNHQLKSKESFYVYIMSNVEKNLFYISVTGYLSRKIRQHSFGTGYTEGLAGVSTCRELIYWEQHEDALEALKRETQLKDWNRKKITNLVTAKNPALRSLNNEICGASSTLL